MNKSEMQEKIDACRDNHDDLRLPEMRELAECVEQDPQVLSWIKRSQQFDSAVADALEDVAVPDELCERLIENVQSSVANESPLNVRGPGDDDVPVERNVDPDSPTLDRKIGRRAFWVGLVTLAVAASVAVMLVPRPSAPIGQEELMAEIEIWTTTLDRSEIVWDQLVATRTDRPIDEKCVMGQLSNVSQLKSRFDGQAAVYELTSNREKAYLFVLRPNRGAALPVSPTPIRGVSGGWSVAAWSKGGLLYVLATRSRRLQDFVKPSPVG